MRRRSSAPGRSRDSCMRWSTNVMLFTSCSRSSTALPRNTAPLGCGSAGSPCPKGFRSRPARRRSCCSSDAEKRVWPLPKNSASPCTRSTSIAKKSRPNSVSGETNCGCRLFATARRSILTAERLRPMMSGQEDGAGPERPDGIIRGIASTASAPPPGGLRSSKTPRWFSMMARTT
jgi:hypothetical protein